MRRFAGAVSRGLGTTVGIPNEVRYGRPDSSTVDHGPLNGLQNGPKAENRPLYGLSALFQVAAAGGVNNPATGAPTITGTAQVGQTLTAGTTGIMDDDGLNNVSYTYQWIRTAAGVDTNISGATASTYTLVAADLGTTIKVRVSFTDDASNAETLTSAATAAVSAVVPSNWTLKPTAVAAGAKFRLLFLSSTRRNASSTDIATYNTFIQTRAANGHADIRDYSAGFRAVGCTAAVDARDNTATTYTTSDKGVPIYWLNGAKAADQYEDFYDGSWDDEADDKNESGTNGLDTSLNENWPLTGCDHDGTAHAALGASQVTRGRPNSSGSGHGPLNGNDQITSGLTSPLYGLSAIFQVAAAVVVPNNPPTGAPTITGTAQVGQTLTAGTTAIMDADGLTSVSYTYQWIRTAGGVDTNISGATASAYTLVAADQGTTIKVRVSFTDDASNAETLTSAATAVVSAAPNTPATGAPMITGTAQVGQTLTAGTTAIMDADGLTSVSYTYQWIRTAAGVDTNISGATASAYTLVAADQGTTIKVRVSFTDDASNAETLTSAATAVVSAAPNTPATGAPMITGTAQVGQTLTAGTTAIMDADGLTSVSYTYQWIRTAAGVDTNISGATASAYTLVAADLGTTIKVRVSFTDDASNAETLTSAATAAVSANNPPTSSNKNLALNEDTELTFFASDFTFTDADGNSLSSVKILSLPATDKGTLTFSGMALTSGDLPQTVPAAQLNSLKYVPPANENGGAIPFTSFTFRVNDGTDDSAATYTLSLFVHRVNDAATGQPGITGTAQVGQTLAATAGTIADVDGLPDPFLTDTNTSFQWVRVTSGTDADISGARDSTYTLVADDEGKKIKVKVSFLDTEATTNRTEGPLTSAATATVSASTNTPATGAPTITGTAQVGQTLTAGITAIMDAEGLTSVSYTYQWIRVDGGTETNISGATASTYTLVAADLGTTIKVRVSFTDDASNAETLTSAATAAVSAVVPSNWTLKPTALATGDKFRLLFLSSTKSGGSSTDIATYNTFVQGLAAAGHTDIRAYSAGFRVVGCTAAVDARDNTSTTYTATDKGVPVYWLNGAKAADEYEDFYDGSWDDEANDKNESGTDAHDTSVSTNYPITGCNHDGTESFMGSTSHALGASRVRSGGLNSSVSDVGPLHHANSAIHSTLGVTRPLYGLSAVFQVAADTTPPTLTSADVEITDALIINLVFSEDLQLSNPPALSAFTVTVDGSAATVSSVGVPGSALPQNALWLQLSTAIRQRQAVVVTYTDATSGDDTAAIQDTAGNDADSFTTGLNGVPAVTNNSTVTNTVPSNWTLKPTALAVGDKFRLLFLSSTKRNSTATDIATYNTFIQGLAAAGHTDIQDYSADFRAVGCTADTDARDNTKTTYTTTDKGVPIYWLNGAKAADQYEDFYDGSWDDEANDKNESGTNAHDTSQNVNWPWTGCDHDGTEAVTGSDSFALGTGLVDARVGRPNSSTSGHGPLNGQTNRSNFQNSPLYGLSAVFEVAAAVVVPNNPPAFSADTAARSVAENTAAGQNVGAALTATDADSDTLTYTLEGTDAASFDIVSGSGQIRTRTGVTYNHEAKSTHTVVVKADDGKGGTDTVTVTITVTDVDEPPGQPAAPTVSATAGSTTSLDVTWTAPTNTGPAIASYDLQYRAGTSGNFTNGPQNVTGTSAAIGSLAADTSYEVQVRATNAEGDGDWSVAGTGRTTASVPGAPTGLTATASGTTQIDLSWSAPGSTGGSAITGYKIEVSPNGTSGWTDQVANTNSTATTYAHTGLAAGDTRHYRVSAINTNGAGTASNVDSATTGTSVPGAPTGLTATASGHPDRPLLERPGQHRRLRHHRLQDRGLAQRHLRLDRPGRRHQQHRHHLRPHRAGRRRHPPLPRLRHQHQRRRHRLQRRQRHHGRQRAGRTHRPHGHGQRGHPDRPLLERPGQHRRLRHHRLQDRGLAQRHLRLDRPGRQHQQHRHHLRPHRAGRRRHPPLPRLRHQHQRRRHRLQRRQRHHGRQRAGRTHRPHGHGQRGHPDRPLLERPGQHRRLRHHRLQDRGLAQRHLRLDRPGRQHQQHRHHLRPHRAGRRRHPPLPRLRHQHQRRRHRLQRRQRHHGRQRSHADQRRC